MSRWRLSYQRHCSFYLRCSLSLRSLSLGETNCHVVNSPTEKPTWQETEVSCQQPARHGGLQKTATWMNLEVDTDDCSLRDIWSARTPQLRYSWIPDSLKIINVCCFKVLSLGVPFMQQQITRTTFFGEKKRKASHMWRPGVSRRWERVRRSGAAGNRGQVTCDFFNIIGGVWTESWEELTASQGLKAAWSVRSANQLEEAISYWGAHLYLGGARTLKPYSLPSKTEYSWVMWITESFFKNPNNRFIGEGTCLRRSRTGLTCRCHLLKEWSMDKQPWPSSANLIEYRCLGPTSYRLEWEK